MCGLVLTPVPLAVACGKKNAEPAAAMPPVLVTRPDGMRRALVFRMGDGIAADTSKADTTGPSSASKEGDITRITVGRERCEVFEAVVAGG